MSVEGIYDLARRADDLALQTRAVGSDVAAARAVVWESTRAQEYRADLAVEAAAVQAAADDLNAAAAALRHHAQQVQHRLDQLDAMRDWFLGKLDDARDTIANAGEGVKDFATDRAHDLLSAAKHLPNPGDLDIDGFVSRFHL